MSKDSWIGILIILGIIFAGIYGGSSKSEGGSIFRKNSSSSTATNTTKTQAQIKRELRATEKEVASLQKKIEAEQQKKIQSKYFGKVSIRVNDSTNVNNEYVLIQNNGTTTIPVTGWTIKSEASGQSVKVPKSSFLFFTGMQNSEDDIYISPKDKLYVLTGYSPNGASFKVNKCSGYLGQFQKFYPSLSTSCPRPRDEDLSSIPKLTINDACFDYIQSYPACKIQTKTVPVNWSYECKNFIYEKINYASCVNTHKQDPDFYKNEWRVYLKRTSPLWKSRRETVILYDLENKVVDTVTY